MVELSRKAFDRLVERAIAELPPAYARWIDEVPIIVEDEPGEKDEVVGLYHGRAMTERSVEESGRLPSQIFLYRRPLMEACTTTAALAEEIRKTLLHELGHHAGLGEEDLDRVGYGPVEEDIDFDVDD
jgi:predicted Zn-dependent protease with MMP-like domain